MKRISKGSWAAWIVVSVAVSVFLLPGIVQGTHGSIAFALFLWAMAYFESKARGFGTKERVISHVYCQLSPGLRGIADAANLDQVRKIGKFVFPKRLFDGWGLAMFASLLGGFGDSIVWFASGGNFDLSAYSFEMIAETSSLVVIQAVFWTRHNLSYVNWKTPKGFFDDVCKALKTTAKQKEEAWKNCLDEDLVVEK